MPLSRIVGGGEREAVGAAFDHARERIRKRHARRAAKRHVEGQPLAVPDAGESRPVDRAHVGGAEKRRAIAPCRADGDPGIAPHVVAEFVRDDEQRFVRREFVDQRIGERDTLGTEHAGDERIRLLRLAAHVEAEDLRVADAVSRRERSDPSLRGRPRAVRTC